MNVRQAALVGAAVDRGDETVELELTAGPAFRYSTELMARWVKWDEAGSDPARIDEIVYGGK